MAKLVIVSKGHAGLSFELDTHWVTIGRAPDNAFQIVESSVSGNHCEVQLRGDELLIRDMRSTNGTFIRGSLVSEGTVKIGETFRLGDLELRLEASRPAVPVVPSVPVSKPDKVKTEAVLLVDDSMAFLETASALFTALSDDSWAIYTACAADQALAVLQQHRIDMVVMDIVMPVLDGTQLLGVVHRRYPHLKKIILSGHVTESSRAAGLAGGADLVLEKPTSKDGFTGVFNVLKDMFSWGQREGFSGTLQHVGLVDVIQLQCIARKSSILEIRDGQTCGEIFIESGVIVHATAGSLVGDQAFHKLLLLTNGEFHLQTFRQPQKRTVQGSWEYLLMESARIRDEAKHAQATADTILITKPGTAPCESLAVLGEDIVVVSTYDGKWHPVDASK